MQFKHQINIKHQFTHNKHVIKHLNTTFEKLQFSPQTLQKLHFCPRTGNYLIFTQKSQQINKSTLKIYSTHQNWIFNKSLQNCILAPEFCVITKLAQNLFSICKLTLKTVFNKTSELD